MHSAVSFAFAGGPYRTSRPTSVFSPLALPNLTGWYDPSAPSGFLVGALGASQLTDLSGNGKHFLQNAGSAQPRLGRTINGLGVLDFQGSQFMQATSRIIDDGPCSIFMVQQIDASGSFGSRLISERTINGFVLSFVADATNQLRALKPTGGFTRVSAATVPTSACVLGVTTDNGTVAANTSLYLDGSELGYTTTTDGSAVVSDTNTMLGIEGSKDNRTVYDGAIGEVVICSGIMTPANIVALSSYLSSKWGTP